MGDRVRRDNARWGERLIRKGSRVRWLGRYYVLEGGAMPRAEYEQRFGLKGLGAPQPKRQDRPHYDGSMDGMRGLFYTYGDHHEGSQTHIYLHSIIDAPWPGPECVAGYFVWDTFVLEGAAE